MREVSDQPSKDFHPPEFDERSSFNRLWGRLPGACRLCHATTTGLLCHGCLADLPIPIEQCRTFSGCTVAGAYEYRPPLSDLIGLAKYGGHRGICRLLGSLVASALPRPPARPVILVPIPMPWPRLLWRGYNHAEEMALALGNLWGCPVDRSLLARQGWQVPQQGLDRNSRLGNLRSAFKCDFKIKGLYLILVDDVCTTGATMDSAARTLLDTGAGCVSGVVLAHRSPKVL